MLFWCLTRLLTNVGRQAGSGFCRTQYLRNLSSSQRRRGVCQKATVLTPQPWTQHARSSGLAFSFFTKSAELEEEEKKDKEDDIILLLKRAKLSVMRGELVAADQILHQAIRLAHQSHNTQAIIYTYDMMANVAFLRGQLSNAEKLFKASMSFLLAHGAKEDDNAVIEMSLKLASIYAAQNQHQLAIHGFQFCTETLEEKIQKQKDLPEEAMSAEERANTQLLLGLCLDSYARYLLTNRQLDQALSSYQRALQISREVQGDSHPQTIVLMNDMATVLDMQGHYDNAYGHVKRALELARETDHPDQHTILCNFAGILMHQGHLDEAGRLYKEALKLAESKGDGEVVEQIKKGLQELSKTTSRAS
ncbi:tetratricopeptide repeat protein 19, mitochondrial isoform X2 [Polyodon spathula]|uniref:tetratricopeptide repeat protein 19, mitochondrial isoform X2 n=1 Tax=Polyodon spathula TaxID=7913 RepID=UPI001B7EAFC4|nr:tetratricopeptide repeat protein 19, mitochondrial isoform X2 [Polyodon spathula]